MERDNGAAELGLDAVYSHSQIQSFLSCEQRYAYAYRDGWKAHRTSRQMTLGTVGHHLLDEWWLGKDIGDFDLDAISQYVVDLAETPTIEECVSIAEHAMWLLRRYDKMYEKDREHITVLEVERFRTFELPQLGERRFGLIVKIDKLMESRPHGGTVFMDHKFSGRLTKEDWIDIDPQFSVYTLALRETNTPVVCSFLDTIRTYRNKKKGEFVEWDDVPVEDSFARVMVDRSDAMLDVVAKDAYRACERMWHLRQRHFEPIRHVSFNCSNCDFARPCYEALQGDAASEQALLRESFDPQKRLPVVRHFDPMEVEVG